MPTASHGQPDLRPRESRERSSAPSSIPFLRARVVERGRHLNNGVDYHEWNPERDPLIPARYSAADHRRASRSARRALLERLGLPPPPGVPVNRHRVAARPARKASRWSRTSSRTCCAATPSSSSCSGSGRVAVSSSCRPARGDVPEARLAFTAGLQRARPPDRGGLRYVSLMPSRYERAGSIRCSSLRYGTIPDRPQDRRPRRTPCSYGTPRDRTGTGPRVRHFTGEGLRWAIERRWALLTATPRGAGTS